MITRDSHRPPTLQALDGIRGIAILFVLLYHVFDYSPWFKFGWTGVDIFFALSGFLITRNLLSDRGHKHALLRFYSKRILRIFPLYYLSLVILALILPIVLPLPGSAFYNTHQPWFWLFADNWLFIAHYPDSREGSYLMHFWSLALEEQYYLLWPCVVLFIVPTRRLIPLLPFFLLLLGIARMLFWFYTNSHSQLFSFFAFAYTRPEGLLVGSSLALAQHNNMPAIRSRLLKLLCFSLVLCAFILLIRFFTPFTIPVFPFGGYLLLALGATALIEYFGDATRHPLFNNRLLMYLGKISFGLYIIHWPLYLLLSGPLQQYLTHLFIRSPTGLTAAIPITTSCICLLLTTATATLSYYGFERYFLRWKKHLSF